jgi:uncharacterized RDD family membrane protein YckC
MPAVGVGRRAIAILIDSLLLLVPVVPLVVHAFSTVSDIVARMQQNPQQRPVIDQSTLGWTNTAIALLAIAWLVYMTLMESAYGASLGKFALRIRVVRVDGQPMDGFRSFLRNIVRAVDAQVFYLVGAIIVWKSPLHQRLGDKAAKTVVVPASFAATYRGMEMLPPPGVAVPPPAGEAGVVVPPRPDR